MWTRGVEVARQMAGPVALAAATVLLQPLRPNPADVALAYLLAVLLASTVGGLWSGALTAVVAALAFNDLFLPPVGNLTIADPANWFALGAFLVTAAVSSQLVARARARSRQAEARTAQTRRLLDLSERILSLVGNPADPGPTLAALAADCGRALATEQALIALWPPDRPEGVFPAATGPAPGWQQACLAAVRRGCRALPEGPLMLRDEAATLLLILPLARRGPEPAVLVARCARPPEPGMPEAVAGLCSLAVERLFLLRQITDGEAVRRSDALKSALLSSVSHELRTPLSAIRVAATALQRADVWADAESRTDLLRTMDEESDRLNRLIANLLTMSRIEAGALTLERRPCEVEALVWEGMRQAGTRLDPRRLVIRVPDGLPEVDCDLGLAGIALANLLDNAAKYTPPDTPIAIGARLSSDGHVVAVWTDDRGPGVPAGEAERIFGRFTRGTVPSGRGPAGTGLGLAIARALVEAHGGRLWVEAGPGGGSRFTSTWPVADAVLRKDGATAKR